MLYPHSEPFATRVTTVLREGRLDELLATLREHPELAASSFVDDLGNQRSLLHVAVDAPGHYPRSREVIAALAAAGADPDAPFVGPHRETPLHWAASNDDVEALEALVAAGATLDAKGGIFADGTPLDDALIFQQWKTARRLVELGATVTQTHVRIAENQGNAELAEWLEAR